MRKTFLILLVIAVGIALAYAYRGMIEEAYEYIGGLASKRRYALQNIENEKNRLKADRIQKEIDILVIQGKICSADSECMMTHSIGPCAFGLTSFNKNTDLEKIKSLYQQKYLTYPVIHQCASPRMPKGTPQAACIQNACALMYPSATSTNGR